MHMMDDFAMQEEVQSVTQDEVRSAVEKIMGQYVDPTPPITEGYTADQEAVLDELGSSLYAGRYGELDEEANEEVLKKLYDCGLLQPEDL